MMDLTAKLTDAAERHGYRSDAYNKVLKEIKEWGDKFNRRQRLRSWFPTVVCCVLIALLAWIVYTILWPI